MDNLSVDLDCTGQRYTCDCGFWWIKGQSGFHNCMEHFMRRQTELNVGLDELVVKTVTPPPKTTMIPVRSDWSKRALETKSMVLELSTELDQWKEKYRLSQQKVVRLEKQLKAVIPKL